MIGLVRQGGPVLRLLQSRSAIPLIMVCITAILVIVPLLRIVQISLTPDGLEAWTDVTNSRLSTNLLWKPITNTMILGACVATGCLLLGGFLAWAALGRFEEVRQRMRFGDA